MNATDSWADPAQGALPLDGEQGVLPLCGELSIAPPKKEPRPASPRNATRVPVEFDAGLRQRGAAAVGAHILDLSTHGFRVETHLDLEVGSPIWLRLPGLEASLAQVMWREGNLVGCAFDRPLHPAVLDLVVRRAGGG